MKKFLILLVLPLFLVGCKKFDDSALWSAINDNTSRIILLEKKVEELNTNVTALQTIVNALNTGEYITNVSELADGTGYTISFSSGKSIVIKHGKNGSDSKDGTNGQNGTNGINGADGVTPVIGVKQDTDGLYYWTLNGSWLLDTEGNKVLAQGTPGANGTNGTSGVTPKFKIDGGNWYVSYDNETTWTLLGQATGDPGTDGESFFTAVSIHEGYVDFTLNDGLGTVLSVPYLSQSILTVNVATAGTLSTLVSPTQRRTVLSMRITGHISQEDIDFITNRMINLEEVDMSGAEFLPSDLFLTSESDIPNKTLRKVILPPCNNVRVAYLANLDEITISSGSTYITATSGGSAVYQFKLVPYLSKMIVAEGVATINAANFYSDTLVDIELPSTLTSIGKEVFYFPHTSFRRLFIKNSVTIRATVPPVLISPATEFIVYDGTGGSINKTLYVPAGSVAAYQAADGWKQFTSIEAIPE